MKVFRGARTIDGLRVEVDGRPLSERHDIRKLTSSGFEWTYEGAGPAQLSLAILAEHLGDGERALALHRSFMREVVANLENDWELTGDDIDAALRRIPGAAQ
jgi:hypothetical protein